MKHIKFNLTVPYSYTDLSEQHVADSLLKMAWGTAIAVILGLIIQVVTASSTGPVRILGVGMGRHRITYLVVFILSMITLAYIRYLLGHGQLNRASKAFVGLMLAIAFLFYLTHEFTNSMILVLSLPVVAAGVLLDRRGLLNMVAVVVVIVAGLGILHEMNVMDRIADGQLTGPETLAYGILILVVEGIMLNLFTGHQRLLKETEAARQAAEEANRVKSQFLAAMSHELRTPLNAILNFTQFVSSGMVGPVNEEQVDLLTKTTESGKHLLALINDVLDISKIEAGAFKLFVEDNVNLNTEVKAVVSAGKTLIGEKPVEIIEEIQPDLPMIAGDKRRIRQIMLNLVSNACKFTDQGTIKISLAQHNGNILFTVRDSGPGIAPEEHELIFETFRQSQAGLRQGEGTGLGLPISRRLAEAHGGRLWLESTPGQGATFYVSLPVQSEKLLPMMKPKKETALVN